MKPEDKSGKDKGKDKDKRDSKDKSKEKDKGKDKDKDKKDKADKDKDKAKGKEPASPKAAASPPKPAAPAAPAAQPPSSPKPASQPPSSPKPPGPKPPDPSPASPSAGQSAPKPPDSKPPDASPGQPSSPRLTVPTVIPANSPIESSKDHMPPGQPPSSPKPPGSTSPDQSPAQASPSSEKSHAESAPKPPDSKPSDASPGQPTPSAESAPAPPGTKPEQAASQAPSTSASATTQISKPSDSPAPPSITTPPPPTTTPASPAPPPPKAPAPPPPKAPAAAPAAKAAATPEPTPPSRGGLVGFDESFSRKLAIWTSDGWAKSVMKIFVRGSYALSWLIWMPILIISTPPTSTLREQLVNLYRGIIWTGIVVLILRVVCKRPKPPKLDGSAPSPYSAYTDLYSFPSNSNAMTMLACRFLTVNYGDGKVTMVAALLVILVALAALTLGRHYLFDVIVGWIIGVVIFCVSKRMWIPMDKCDQYVKRINDALHI